MASTWNNAANVTGFTVRPPRQARHWRGKRMVWRYRMGLAVGSTVTIRRID